MADRLRGLTPRVRHSSPAFCHAGHAPWTSWRRSRVLKPPQRLPTESLLHLHFLRAQRRVRSRPPLLRLCPACLPPRKRVAQFTQSCAVVVSTLSTSPSGQSSLGKGVFAVFPIAAITGPRRSWRSTRPAATVVLPYLSTPCACFCVRR